LKPWSPHYAEVKYKYERKHELQTLIHSGVFHVPSIVQKTRSIGIALNFAYHRRISQSLVGGSGIPRLSLSPKSSSVGTPDLRNREDVDLSRPCFRLSASPNGFDYAVLPYA
jgi:hypothetical protein